MSPFPFSAFCTLHSMFLRGNPGARRESFLNEPSYNKRKVKLHVERGAVHDMVATKIQISPECPHKKPHPQRHYIMPDQDQMPDPKKGAELIEDARLRKHGCRKDGECQDKQCSFLLMLGPSPLRHVVPLAVQTPRIAFLILALVPSLAHPADHPFPPVARLSPFRLAVLCLLEVLPYRLVVLPVHQVLLARVARLDHLDPWLRRPQTCSSFSASRQIATTERAQGSQYRSRQRRPDCYPSHILTICTCTVQTKESRNRRANATL